MTQALQPTTGSLIARGLQFHQQGELVRAEQVYLAVLAREPRHADALHLMGLVKGRLGLNAEGICLIEEAIAVNPRVSIYHNNLGNLRARIGDTAGAEASYRQAIEVDARNADAWLNLGKLLAGGRQSADAKDCLLASLRMKPSSVEAHMSLGRLEEAAENHQAALESYRSALRIDPQFAPGHLAAGNVYSRLGEMDAAEQSYAAALAIDPSFADGYFNLARLNASSGRLIEAAVLYRKSIALAPGDAADAYNNLGSVLSDLGLHREAEAAYTKAVELRPEFDEALVNLGNEQTTFGDEACGIQTLWRAIAVNPAKAAAYLQLGATAQKRGFLGEAIGFYRQALERDSHSRGARRNLATALSYQGELEGLRMLEALVQEQPLDAEDHWTWAEHLLMHGSYTQGWDEYEWRLRMERLASQHRPLDKPRWRGEPLEGKSILIYAEQGHGDTIQFSRFAGFVAERGGRVIFQVQPSLQRLLSDLPGVAQCIAQGDAAPAFDVCAPLMSLPHILKLGPGRVPLPMLRCSADQGSVVSAIPAIPALQRSSRFRVGIAWAGSPKHARDHLRSTRLSQWAELASIERVDFVSLQAGEAASQAQDAAHPFRFVADCDKFADFAETADIIKQLDLVVTVDTAVAHLAGSLGKPVWILLYTFGDWRWGVGQACTDWYPTARLFRQGDPPDWDAVFQAVAAALREHVARRFSDGG